jgi:hypothetical protein
MFIQAIELAQFARGTVAGRAVADPFGGAEADLAAVRSG